MGGGDGGDGGGRTFPILYITTPDHSPHGGFTGSSSSNVSSSLRELVGANKRHPEDRRVRKRLGSLPA